MAPDSHKEGGLRDPNVWIEYDLAQVLGLPNGMETMRFALSLEPDSVFNTAQEAKDGLDLTFLPETVEGKMIPLGNKRRPRGLIRYCLVPVDSKNNLRELCKVDDDYGLVPVDNRNGSLLVPTAYLDESRKNIKRDQESKDRDRAVKEALEKHADFWEKKDDMTVKERVAWMREELARQGRPQANAGLPMDEGEEEKR